MGAVFFAIFFTYLTGNLSEEPFQSGVINMVQWDIIEQEWHVTFVRAILCRFLVTVAMLHSHDGISKALGLHLPFFVSIAAKSPHTVEQMYVGAVGMMLGPPARTLQSVWHLRHWEMWEKDLSSAVSTFGGFTSCVRTKVLDRVRAIGGALYAWKTMNDSL